MEKMSDKFILSSSWQSLASSSPGLSCSVGQEELSTEYIAHCPDIVVENNIS